MNDYDDDYPGCRETYATFRLFDAHVEPREVSRRLALAPTGTHRRGDRVSKRSTATRREHGWLLSTKGEVLSKDTRRHLDWLLDRLEPVRPQLEELQQGGAETDVFCFWESAHGQGGPTLSPKQMRRLAALDLECGYDVYYTDEEERDSSDA